jgi:integrase
MASVGRKKKTTHTSGLYRKRLTIGRDSTGAPIKKAIYAHTKAELDEKVGAVRAEYRMGTVVSNRKSTWGYWAALWQKLSYPNMGKSTQTMYDAALKHLSEWKNIPISKLRPVNLSAITEQMYNSGYSKRTIKSVISVARQVSKLARKNNAMMLNLAEDVHPNRNAGTKSVAAITPEEEALLWNVKPLPAHTQIDKRRARRLPLIRMLALMQLNCGLRREEAVALEWDTNIDLKNKIVRVTNAYSYADDKIKSPKTNSGYREIPIPDKYLNELIQWKEANQGGLLGRKYVFPGHNGIISEGAFSGLWGILMDAINGITVSDRISAGRSKKVHKVITLKHYFTSHQLRHTFATHCDALGISPRIIQYLMGHASFSMTMHYTHVSEEALDDARRKLNAKPKQIKSGQRVDTASGKTA